MQMAFNERERERVSDSCFCFDFRFALVYGKSRISVDWKPDKSTPNVVDGGRQFPRVMSRYTNQLLPDLKQ